MLSNKKEKDSKFLIHKIQFFIKIPRQEEKLTANSKFPYETRR